MVYGNSDVESDGYSAELGNNNNSLVFCASKNICVLHNYLCGFQEMNFHCRKTFLSIPLYKYFYKLAYF